MNTTKLRKLLGAALLLGVLGLTGCGGGGAGSSSATGSGSTATALYTTAPSAVTVATGMTETYTIAGGTAPYTASSSNPGVVTVSVSGSTMTVTSVATGTVNIVVHDAAGASVTIAVTVGSSGSVTALYTTAPSAVTINTGGTAAYSIAGGSAPYTAASSNPAVAAVTVSNQTMNITGIVPGTASIVVHDTTGTAVTIAVTVANSAGASLYTTAPVAITIAATGASGAQTYTIGGGTAPYNVTSDNTNVATASVTGSTMTITGVADGKANILVRDATGTASVTIAVNVATGSGFTVIGSGSWTVSGGGLGCNTTNPSPYSVYFINGGVAPYTVSSSSPLVGTIIGVGTAAAPLATPTGAKSVSLASWTVASGGYFVVAWPNANNNCASGAASFKVIDSTGLLPASTPTFTVTYTP